MPDFEITDPNGKKFIVTAPDGASHEQVLSYAQSQFKPPAPEASAMDKRLGSWAGRTALGMASPLLAGAQLLGGEKGREIVADIEASKRRGMAAEGKEGFDWYGLAGSAIPAAGVARGVSSLLPNMPSTGGRMLQGAAAGGATAALSPVTQPGDFYTEKVKQTLFGMGIGGLVPLAAQIPGAIKAVAEPFYQRGREAIVGRTLNAASGGQEQQVAQALANARQLVPGSEPTVAQASQNAGISALERAASAVNPEVKVAYQGREAAQNAARQQALQGIAGDENAMAAAVQARKTASQPFMAQVNQSTAEVDPSRTASLIQRIIDRSPGRTQLTNTLAGVKKSLYEDYPLAQRGKDAWDKVGETLKQGPLGAKDIGTLRDVRTVMDRVKNGRIEAEEALAQLKGMSGKNPAVQSTIDEVKGLMKAPDDRLRSNASELYQGARKNITDLLSAKAGDGSKLNEAISRELTVVLKSLDHQINKAEPAYGKFMSAYAEQSKPINQMDVARAIQDKSINKVTDVVQPNAYANALSDKVAQQSTGFKRATLEGTMTPQQMQTLNAVRDDLSRAVTARNIGGTRGSDTVQNLAYTNMIDRAGVPTFLRELGPAQIAGNLAGRAASTVYGQANRDIANQLAMTMLNPQAAAQAMRAGGPSRFAPLIEALIKQASATGGAVPSQMPGGQ